MNNPTITDQLIKNDMYEQTLPADYIAIRRIIRINWSSRISWGKKCCSSNYDITHFN